MFLVNKIGRKLNHFMNFWNSSVRLQKHFLRIGIQQPTSLKMLMAVRDVLLDETWNTDEMLNELAEAMHVKFQKYWAAPSMILLIAAVLDPSMKADFVRFFYLTLGENAEEKMREVRHYLRKYYVEYEAIVRSSTLPVFIPYEEEALSQGDSSSSGLRGKRRVQFTFAQFSSQNSSTRLERSELDIYLDDPRVIVRSTENFNVLAWWKKNSDAYPILSLMAKDFLSIPVTTVSSESAFSAAGRILGKNRTSLSPEALEALVCAKDWLIGFNDEDEGQPLTGQPDDEDD